MCFTPGILVNETIVEDNTSYNLRGMVCPEFQNEGQCNVLIDGRTLKPGDSFGVNAQGVVLENEISIVFLSQEKSEKNLKIGYVRIIE